MEYKIGEVSRILRISDQMIRYYEKEGVISPKRTGDGKYRTYSVMDVFLLYEAMKYKQWNINIKDIKDIFSNDYFHSMVSKIDEFSTYLKLNISKEQLLLKRIQQIKDSLDICQFNIDNYWIEKVPCRYAYYSNKAKEDHYELVSMDKNMEKFIFDKNSISFFDVMVIFKKGYEEWYYSIDKEYHDALKIEDHGKYNITPSQICLCTIINMGEVGEFNQGCLNNVLKYANQKNYEIISDIYGCIIGRGIVNGKFNRMMKIYVPIKSL